MTDTMGEVRPAPPPPPPVGVRSSLLSLASLAFTRLVDSHGYCKVPLVDPSGMRWPIHKVTDIKQM